VAEHAAARRRRRGFDSGRLEQREVLQVFERERDDLLVHGKPMARGELLRHARRRCASVGQAKDRRRGRVQAVRAVAHEVVNEKLVTELLDPEGRCARLRKTSRHLRSRFAVT
jgi:hypothetical protein